MAGDGRVSTAAGRLARSLPRPVGDVVERARQDDVFLHAAALAFYALLSAVPMVIVLMWVTSALIGEQEVRGLARAIGGFAPESLGAEQAFQRVAETGTRLGAISLLLAMWPASAYGSGLARAFERLSPRRDHRMKGLRGRALALVVLLPLLSVGSLLAAYAGTRLVGDGPVLQAVGLVIGLLTGFVGAAAASAVIYLVFPQERLGGKALLKGTVFTATGVSVLSAVLVLYLNVGANFQEHYATSGIAGLVFLALWLFLSNALLLVGYRVALEA